MLFAHPTLIPVGDIEPIFDRLRPLARELRVRSGFIDLVFMNDEGCEEFRRFKEARPPLYCTSWMYGGNVLLFYRAGEEHHADSETVIDGLGCKVWYAGSLGMHPRDLFLLADVLEDPGEVEDFQWESTSAH